MVKPATLIKLKEKPLPTASYQLVTPGQAQLWLDDAAKNRKLSQIRITRYAAAMERGDWMVTNQGIAFDEQGQLIDGQHRLHALIKAGVSITLLIITATNNRSQLVLDQGYKRTPHDQIGLREGWVVHPIHTATARAMIIGVGGPRRKERENLIYDLQLLDRFYVKHHKAIEFVVESMWSHNRIKSIQGVVVAPSMAPVARTYYTIQQSLLTHFCEVLATGMSDTKGDGPIIVLRNWLLAGREKQLSSRTGKDRNTIYKKTTIALAAYLNGDSIQRLSQMDIHEEVFPLPRTNWM